MLRRALRMSPPPPLTQGDWRDVWGGGGARETEAAHGGDVGRAERAGSGGQQPTQTAVVTEGPAEIRTSIRGLRACVCARAPVLSQPHAHEIPLALCARVCLCRCQ